MIKGFKKNLALLGFIFASFASNADDIIKSEYTVKSGDALISILNKNDVDKSDINNLIYNSKNSKKLLDLRIGQSLTIYKKKNGELIKLISELKNQTDVLVASKTERSSSYEIKKGKYKLNEISRYKIGQVKYSLNKTLIEMGLSKSQRQQFRDMFDPQMNLNKIAKGTEVIAVYTEFYKGKKKIHDGEILSGEVNHGSTKLQAFLFKDSNGGSGYFASNGKPLSEGFDRIPLKDYKRVSSRFSNKRKHPVLGFVRPHRGVDYAAKTGTPIYASASGKIAMKDYQKKGFGHVIVINHSDGYSTLYGHMKKAAKGIYAGKKVNKGDVIGYVGTSGTSTGPHLHFEIRKNGIYLDPQVAEVPTGNKLAKKDVNAFSHFVKIQNEGFKLAKILNKKEGKTTIAIRRK